MTTGPPSSAGTRGAAETASSRPRRNCVIVPCPHSGGDQFAQQAHEPLAAQRYDPLADLQLIKIVERLASQEQDRRARHQAQRLPVTQPFGAVVARLADDDALAGLERVEPLQLPPVREGALARRDGMAVRVLERLAEVGGDGLLQP